MILKCRRDNDATKILALTLKVSPEHQSVDRALSKDVLECVCENSLARLTHIDALSASNGSKVRTLAISLAKVTHPRGIGDVGRAAGVFVATCGSVSLMLSCKEIGRCWNAFQSSIGAQIERSTLEKLTRTCKILHRSSSHVSTGRGRMCMAL